MSGSYMTRMYCLKHRHSGVCIFTFALLGFLCVLAQPRSATALVDAQGLASYDLRAERAAGMGAAGSATTTVLPTSPERQRAVDRLGARTPGLEVSFDPFLGTPRFVRSTQAFLTAPAAAGKWRQILETYVLANSDLFGVTREMLSDCVVCRDFVTRHSGVRHVTLQQQIDGRDVLGAQLSASLTKDGCLINVSCTLVTAETGRERAAVLSAEAALQVASRSVGVTPPGSAVRLPGSTADRVLFGAAAGLSETARAALRFFPMDGREVTPAWAVEVSPEGTSDHYCVIVDAADGTVLRRFNRTKYQQDPATYLVFADQDGLPLQSPQPWTGTLSGPELIFPPEAPRTRQRLRALDEFASPLGWIAPGATETRGNNVDAHTDQDADNDPDLPRPDGGEALLFDFPLRLSVAPSNHPRAAVTNLFYLNNYAHDFFYRLGFDEPAGNYQSDNFGRGGVGNDWILAQSQDGAGYNNANFYAPTDGTHGRMQMFIFRGEAGIRDGSFDSQIVIHEYTHGVSMRLHYPQGGLNTNQSDALGEGWSDFFALAMLARPDDDPHGTYSVGAYAQYVLRPNKAYYFGIRRFPYSTDLNVNPLTFADIDPEQYAIPDDIPVSFESDPGEIHNAGELWTAMLWDCRAALIDAHGYAGHETLMQLVIDGMKLSPGKPTFVDGRDAILQADLVNNGGENLELLWRAFARRGLGYGAAGLDTSTTSDIVESFHMPPEYVVTPRGDLALSAAVFRPDDTIVATLHDEGLIGQGPVVLTATASSGDIERLVLEQQGLAGSFTGSLGCAAAESVSTYSGVLEVGHGDVVTVEYEDRDDGTGVARTVRATASIDALPPVLVEVSAVGLSPDGFTLLVRTDEPARLCVDAGLDPENLVHRFCTGEGLSTTHTLLLEGWPLGASVWAGIVAWDVVGNVAADDNDGDLYKTVLPQPNVGAFYEGFDGGAAPGWTHSSEQAFAPGDPPDNWNVRKSPEALSPEYVYAFDVDGYSTYVDARLVSPPVTGGGVLSFWHNYNIERGWDAAVLEVSLDDGRTWTNLEPYILRGGYNGTTPFFGPAWTGRSDEMQKVVVDLSSFAGSIRIGWRFLGDEFIASENWQIDEVFVGQLRTQDSREAGQVFLDLPVYTVHCEEVGVEVLDANAGAAALTVTLTTGAGDRENLSAAPQGAGLYRGSLPKALPGEEIVPGDGRVQSDRHDSLRAEYTDVDDGSGQSAVVHDEATIDTLIYFPGEIQDGGFEMGEEGPWEETHLHYSPLFHSDAYSHGGSWLAWFGGLRDATERGSLTQRFVIHPDHATLSYFLRIETEDVSPETDTLQVFLDDQLLAEYHPADAERFAEYAVVNHVVSQFADGGEHELAFRSLIGGPGVTSFFVDDVSIRNATARRVVRLLDAEVEEGTFYLPTEVRVPVDLYAHDIVAESLEVGYRVEPRTAGANDLAGPTSGTLVFDAGALRAYVPVQIVADSLREETEEFDVFLTDLPDSVLATRDQATVRILDDDRPASFAFGYDLSTRSFTAIDLETGMLYDEMADTRAFSGGDLGGENLTGSYYTVKNMDDTLLRVDLEDQVVEPVGVIRGLEESTLKFTDVAWNIVDERLYGMARNVFDNGWIQIGAIDLETARFTKLGDFRAAGVRFLNLSISNLGEFHVSAWHDGTDEAYLYRLDMEAQEAVALGALFPTPSMVRLPIEFDHSTGLLHYPQTREGATTLIALDLEGMEVVDQLRLQRDNAYLEDFAIARTPPFFNLSANPAATASGRTVEVYCSLGDNVDRGSTLTVTSWNRPGRVEIGGIAECVLYLDIYPDDPDGAVPLTMTARDETGRTVAQAARRVLHVDSTPPSSRVLEPDGYQRERTARIVWEAEDPVVNGFASGLESVAIYWRRREDGQYHLLDNFDPTQREALFDARAANDGTFEFYSISSDAVGNIEAFSSEPDVVLVIDQSIVYNQTSTDGLWVNAFPDMATLQLRPASPAPENDIGFTVDEYQDPAGGIVFGQWQMSEDGEEADFSIPGSQDLLGDQVYRAYARLSNHDAPDPSLCPGYRLQYANAAYTHLGGIAVETFDAANAPSREGDFTAVLLWRPPWDLVDMDEEGTLSDWPFDPGRDLRDYTLLFDLYHTQRGDRGTLTIEEVLVEAVPLPDSATETHSYEFLADWQINQPSYFGFASGFAQPAPGSITLRTGDYWPGPEGRFIAVSPPIASGPGDLAGNPPHRSDQMGRFSIRAVSINEETTPVTRIYVHSYTSAIGPPEWRYARNMRWFSIFGAVTGFVKLPTEWGGRSFVSPDQPNPGIPPSEGARLECLFYTHESVSEVDDYLYPEISVLSLNRYADGQSGWADDSGGVVVSDPLFELY